MSTKRPRASSILSQSAQSSSSSLAPDAKQSRIASDRHKPFQCTLPPTCSSNPTDLASLKELESHYATYHAHVCEELRCGSVFPNERLLELHQIECHDPFAAVRKERGEKIFACHLPECNRRFSNPKNRRLHLIQAHNYPKEYFFAVTNKGIGGLLRKWGEGASMIRGEWIPRTAENDAMDLEGTSEDTSDDENGEESFGTGLPIMNVKADDAMDSITNAMDSLAFVPSNVRFGRGAKTARLPITGAKKTNRAARSGSGTVSASGTEANNYSRSVRGGSAHSAESGGGSARSRGRGRGISGSSGVVTKVYPVENAITDEEPVSINIEGALNALKEEASSTGRSETGSILPTRDFENRTRVAGRGFGRGRGPSSRGRSRGFLR